MPLRELLLSFFCCWFFFLFFSKFTSRKLLVVDIYPLWTFVTCELFLYVIWHCHGDCIWHGIAFWHFGKVKPHVVSFFDKILLKLGSICRSLISLD